MIDVSVIIVSYNTKDLLKACVESILQNTKDCSFEIIVSDNGSDDGSCEMLKDSFPQVLLVKNNANLGFGAGNNRGASLASGKYVFFLNPDTLLLNDAISMLYRYFESHKDGLGVIGCYLLDRNMGLNLSYLRMPLSLPFLVLANVKNLIKSWFNCKPKIYVDKYQTEKDISVDHVIGADMFMPRQLFENIGCFDENIFMYCDETDLQHRVRALKLDRRIISGPRIVHLEDQCKKSSNQKRIWSTKSLLYYYKKYYKFYPLYCNAIKWFYKLNFRELRKYTKKENEVFFKVFN